MKNYYDRNYKAIKSRSYLITGLIMSALAVFMTVLAALSITHKADTAIIVSGFSAGAAWMIASFISLRVYYRDNRIEIKEKAKEIAETVEKAVKK